MIMTLDYCSLQRVEQETSGRCINVEVNRRPSMRIIRKMALNMRNSHGIEGLPFWWSWLLFMKSAEGWTSNQWSMHQGQQVSSITTFQPLPQLRCLEIICRRWYLQLQLCKNMFQIKWLTTTIVQMFQIKTATGWSTTDGQQWLRLKSNSWPSPELEIVRTPILLIVNSGNRGFEFPFQNILFAWDFLKVIKPPGLDWITSQHGGGGKVKPENQFILISINT